MNHIRGTLLAAAALLSIYATASFFTAFDTDFKVSAILAILCLCSVPFIDYHQAEHDAQIAMGRAEVWMRRDTELRECDCGESFEVLPTAPAYMVCPTCAVGEFSDERFA